MNKALLLLSAGILVFSSCESKKSSSEASSSPELSTTASTINLDPEQFQEMSANGIIVDVRTAEEVAAGKIPGSITMDFYQNDFLTKVNDLPKDREIYLYCAVGGRSAEAADLLIQQGFTKVYHLKGGIQAWAAKGLPISQE